MERGRSRERKERVMLGVTAPEWEREKWDEMGDVS